MAGGFSKTPGRSRGADGAGATGATTGGTGDVCATTGTSGGFATGRGSGGRTGFGGVSVRARFGSVRTGLRRALLPFSSARGAGVGWRRPPPPPPPPGPGMARNTSRMCLGVTGFSAAAVRIPNAVSITRPATSAACNALAAAKRAEEKRFVCAGGWKSAGCRSGSSDRPVSSRVARTASASVRNRNRVPTVETCVDRMSASTSRTGTTAARATSRTL